MPALKFAALGLAGFIGVVVSMFGVKVPFAESLAKEHWRHGLIAAILILALIPSLIALFLYLVDANRFKSEIVAYVKAQTQRDLVIAGDIEVSFFPKLGLDTGRMSLTQRNSAREFASLDNARLHITWWPLFRKQLVFDRIDLDGLNAKLIRRQDGSTNFDDLLIGDEHLAPMSFDIDGIRVTRSAIEWEDEIEWQKVSLKDIELTTGRLADAVPSRLTARFHLDLSRAGTRGQVALESSYFHDSKTGRYEFADLHGQLQGESTSLSNLVVDWKGNLEVQPAAGVLSGEQITASVSGKSGQRSLTGKLALAKLRSDKDGLSARQFGLEATLSDAGRMWTASMQSPELALAHRVLRSAAANATLDLKTTEWALHGEFSSPLNISFETTSSLRLDPISLRWSARHPMLLGEVGAGGTASLQADFGAHTLSLGVTTKLDDSTISAAADFTDFDLGATAAGTFEIAIDRLDIDRYLAPDWSKRWTDEAASAVPRFSGLPAMHGKLRADQLKFMRAEFGALSAEIDLKQSVLEIAPLAATVHGGELTGAIGLALQGLPRLTLKQDLKGFQAASLLATTGHAGHLAGSGNLALDLNAEGDTVAALRKSLRGSIALALEDGALAGIDLGTAIAEGRSDLASKGKERVGPANFSASSAFSALDLRFDVADGRAHATSVVVKSPLIHSTGEGDITLASGEIDFRLQASVIASRNRRPAGEPQTAAGTRRELAELEGLVVPVRVNGEHGTPTIALDFGNASGAPVNRLLAAKEAEAARAAEAAKTAAKEVEAARAAQEVAAKAAAARAAAKAEATARKAAPGNGKPKEKRRRVQETVTPVR